MVSKRRFVPTKASSDSKVQRNQSGLVNINDIMARARRTQTMPEVEGKALGIFLDVSEVGDFQSLQNRVREGQELFQSLPAKVRDRFQNDAGKFMDFVADPANGKALVSMGLAKPADHVSEVEPAAAAAAGPVAPVAPQVPSLSISELRAKLAALEKAEGSAQS